MNEADIKRAIVRSVKFAGGYARRIEDSYAVGLFDLILIPHELPVFFAEVKLVRNGRFGPTPRQYVELDHVKQVAGNDSHVIPIMIGWHNHTYYFSNPRPIIKCVDCFSVTTSDMEFHDQLVQYYHSQKG